MWAVRAAPPAAGSGRRGGSGSARWGSVRWGWAAAGSDTHTNTQREPVSPGDAADARTSQEHRSGGPPVSHSIIIRVRLLLHFFCVLQSPNTTNNNVRHVFYPSPLPPHKSSRWYFDPQTKEPYAQVYVIQNYSGSPSHPVRVKQKNNLTIAGFQARKLRISTQQRLSNTMRLTKLVNGWRVMRDACPPRWSRSWDDIMLAVSHYLLGKAQVHKHSPHSWHGAPVYNADAAITAVPEWGYEPRQAARRLPAVTTSTPC